MWKLFTMKKLIITIILLFANAMCFAQNYAVSQIPKELFKNANVIIRVHEEEYIVRNKSQATHKKKFAATLLNDAAKDYLNVEVYYNSLVTIKNFKAATYDPDGKLIKRAKTSDIRDFSAGSSISLIDDSRVKLLQFVSSTYPITVEYEVEYDDRNLLFYPRWSPQYNTNISVENSTFKIISPSNLPVRYKVFNISDPNITEDKNGVNYFWSVSNLSAQETEPHAPYSYERFPMVFTAATLFQVQGYDGDLSTWESFARWNYELNKGRLELPADIKAKVDELIAGVSDEKEKIKILYNYLQQTTRYIGVQLGIGGWQTFDAKYVAERKYGDCKALTNYMMALLAHANIKSYYTLIKAGDYEEPILEDFPRSAFNHVILAIPVKSDTVWLECTSQQALPGYLGSFTGNRKALLVTENGGKLVNTPKYSTTDNQIQRNIKVTFSEDGTAMANIQTLYTGTMQDDLWHMVKTQPKDELRKILINKLNLPNSIIQNFEYQTIAAEIPKVTETASLQLNKYATITGKRFNLNLNMLSKWQYVPRAVSNRTLPILLRNSYSHYETIIYTIPEGYTLESKPQNTRLETAFGKYSAEITIKGNTIQYTRSLIFNPGKFEAEKYTELIEFYSNIAKADNARVVLVK